MKTLFEKTSCTLTVGDTTMTYYHHSTGLSYTLSPYKLLIDILSDKDVCPNRDISSKRLSIQRQIGGSRYYRLDDLAFACYHGWIKSIRSWEDDMKEFGEWKGKRVIDHADNDPYNATEYNLSVMTLGLNSSKGSITGNVKLPVSLCTAYVGNEYRVQIIWNTIRCNLSQEPGFAKMRFICYSAEDFVDCLKQLVAVSPEWYRPLRKGRNWLNSENSNIFDNADFSVIAQNALAKADRKGFDTWKYGTKLGSLRLTDAIRAVAVSGDTAIEFVKAEDGGR